MTGEAASEAVTPAAAPMEQLPPDLLVPSPPSNVAPAGSTLTNGPVATVESPPIEEFGRIGIWIAGRADLPEPVSIVVVR